MEYLRRWSSGLEGYILDSPWFLTWTWPPSGLVPDSMAKLSHLVLILDWLRCKWSWVGLCWMWLLYLVSNGEKQNVRMCHIYTTNVWGCWYHKSFNWCVPFVVLVMTKFLLNLSSLSSITTARQQLRCLRFIWKIQHSENQIRENILIALVWSLNRYLLIWLYHWKSCVNCRVIHVAVKAVMLQSSGHQRREKGKSPSAVVCESMIHCMYDKLLNLPLNSCGAVCVPHKHWLRHRCPWGPAVWEAR